MKEKKKKNGPVTVIIVGAGHRALIYAQMAITNPELMQVVGVVDPNPVRSKLVRKRFNLPEEMCFSSVEELVKKGKLADAIINGTMDELHVETSIPLLECGYDMLLEKPFAVNEEEALRLEACARKNHSKVMICHVLRYAPFYYSIKDRIVQGDIGDIINIQMAEHVSYHHLSTAFVRGKWANSQKSHSSMLLQKCCHDMDLMMWLMNETTPAQITSFGGKYQFKPENAPEGAGNICMVDCPHVETCRYSAKRLYIDHPERWSIYVWDRLEHLEDPAIEDKIALMKSDSPYARCIYKCDNDIVDHQSVMVNFASGATGTLNMIGGCATGERKIHVIGTKGEISGNFSESKYILRKINPSIDAVEGEYDEEIVDLKITGDMVGAYGGHGGGDERLVIDFVKFIRGEEPSLACTSIFDSMTGHLSVYRADSAREDGEIKFVK